MEKKQWKHIKALLPILSGDMQSCVDDIVANEIEKHPRKMSILLAKLGKIAFVKDWACGDKIRRLN